MFENYLKIALRAMAKNKLYAAINIIGLAIGLCVFLFAQILVHYEQTHDNYFTNHERIYTIGYRLTPDANMGVKEFAVTHSAMGPFIKAELSEVETVARTVHSSYVVSIGDNNFHEQIKFAEADFLKVFDFDYLQGQQEALQQPNSMVINQTTAQKWFGRSDVVGETVLVNGSHPMQITAVINDVPSNSHFNAMIIGRGLNVVAALAALTPLEDYDVNGNWSNLNSGDHTYILTHKPLSDREQFEHKVNSVYRRHAPGREDNKSMIDSIRLRNLAEVNTALFDMTGLPIVSSVQLLGLLILIIAIVNYTNLASAQSMGRAREVGLRKTMGASKTQLMLQFMVESVATVIIAMLLAMTALELIIPPFNVAANKVIALDYLSLGPMLLLTTLLTSLLAGAYPSYLITRTTTLDALKDANNKGQKGGLVRSLMIGTQFTLSIFMLALVLTVFFQNQKVAQSASIFPKDQVLVLNRIGTEDIMKKEQVIRRELLAIDGVENVAFTSITPFEQSNNNTVASRQKGDENGLTSIHQMNVSSDFIKTLDVPMIAGRDLTPQDKRVDSEVRIINVLLNELAVTQFGFDSPQQAIGESLWGATSENPNRDNLEYRIVGVVADRNYQGLHNKLKPFMHYIGSYPRGKGLVRISDTTNISVLNDIEAAWKRIFPDYPLEQRYLDAVFNDIYQVYQAMSGTLAGFALVAMMLALIGLFGLAAFMARGRTKEIGVRKVMGASVPQIVRLLLWQFSKPVMWAFAVAMPLAAPATSMYLNFFAERTHLHIPLVLLSGVLGIVLAGCVISVHAIRVAKASPINALRYE